MDNKTKEDRSRNMARIRYKDTAPEIKVRKSLWKLGYRYRLNTKKFPGKPDIVLGSRKVALFVNGCFWHQHPGCKRNFMPKSNINYWEPKLKGNVERLEKNREKLQKLGYKTSVIWECQTKSETDLSKAVYEIKKLL